ncbi:hypothetical protein K2173_000566 [Erythroxylum novogranatense]|uniref:VOC domain-containing protein n=1 Tax=Erythroxylum novogranatense TaxID=1862640 RepID=A0AAV8S7X5_9ROSI|nr:hypothetical protein K2173_000566 [Erythroxylum novogranatense]
MAQQEVQNGGSEVVFTAMKPQLLVEAPKASDAVQFYKAAFGAVETSRTTQPKRKADQELPHIISAQLQLAGSTILVSDIPEQSPLTAGAGIAFCLETDDVEAAMSKAVAAGAVAEHEVSEGTEGSCVGSGRVGKVKDPYGYVWFICAPDKKPCSEAEA